ncbi:hypothetical protein EJB05_40366, partial [Eragrostis curvula]
LPCRLAAHAAALPRSSTIDRLPKWLAPLPAEHQSFRAVHPVHAVVHPPLSQVSKTQHFLPEDGQNAGYWKAPVIFPQTSNSHAAVVCVQTNHRNHLILLLMLMKDRSTIMHTGYLRGEYTFPPPICLCSSKCFICLYKCTVSFKYLILLQELQPQAALINVYEIIV